MAISSYSSNESTLCSALRLTEALSQPWSCASKLTLLGTDLTDDAVLFKAFAALPVESQPTSPWLVLLHHFFFQIPQLWPGMHSPCTLLCPGWAGVLLQMNVVGWSVNIAVCSEGECLHSVTHLSPPAPPRSASALSLLISWCVIWGRAISQNWRQAGVPSA